MKALTDPRHTARRLALSSLFCWVFSDPGAQDCVVLSKELLQSDQLTVDYELVTYLVEGVKDKLDRIDTIIAQSAPEWPIDKIAKVDLVILRIAIYEIVFGKKTPIKVAIDEAIELSKEFGNDTSHKFVNGVLGTVVEKYAHKPEALNEEQVNEQ